MDQFNFHKNIEPLSPPPRLLPVLQKLKDAYLIWYKYYSIIPKVHRYSLGEKIDKLFVEAESNEMKEGAKLLMNNAANIKEEAKKQALCCYCSKPCMIIVALLLAAIVALIVLYFIYWRKRSA